MGTEGHGAEAYQRRVEAVLFAAAEPLRPDDIRGYAGDGDLPGALAALQAHYDGRGMQLVQRGGRWHFQTAADLADVLRPVRDAPKPLGRAAMEVLAIVAYGEPATRAEIEEVRGVSTAAGTLDVLMQAGWVRPAGRRATPGRPVQYATTPAFLAHFGLESRRDLPGLAELRAAGLLAGLDAPGHDGVPPRVARASERD